MELCARRHRSAKPEHLAAVNDLSFMEAVALGLRRPRHRGPLPSGPSSWAIVYWEYLAGVLTIAALAGIVWPIAKVV